MLSKLYTLECFAVAIALAIIALTGFDHLSGNAKERRHKECISFGDSMSAMQEKYCEGLGA